LLENHQILFVFALQIHNIDRCLQVLQANDVVLNDVTAQGVFSNFSPVCSRYNSGELRAIFLLFAGLYRGELKCVLALFFHLSRYKQKRLEFKMTDKYVFVV